MKGDIMSKVFIYFKNSSSSFFFLILLIADFK